MFLTLFCFENIGAAVGMIVQKALAAKSMDDVCDNKYVKMAHSIGNLNWELQQVINLLGCNQRYSKKGVTSTTSATATEENQEEEEEEEALESSLTPEKEEKIRQLLLENARREKGSKRKFLKDLFGLNKKDKAFKQGQKIPSSSYKLDKNDAKVLEDLEKDIEQYRKSNI